MTKRVLNDIVDLIETLFNEATTNPKRNYDEQNDPWKDDEPTWHLLAVKQTGKDHFADVDKKQPHKAINEHVYCKDCKYLMFSDCYGECSKAYRGIVNPDDSCGKGKRRDKDKKEKEK